MNRGVRIAGWSTVPVLVAAAWTAAQQPAGTAASKPTNPPAAPAAQPEGGDREKPKTRADDRSFSRAMLVRFLEDMDKRKPVLQEAIRKLDAGEPVEQVRQWVRENSPPLWRMGGGPGRDPSDSIAMPDRGPGRPPEDGPPQKLSPEEREKVLVVMGALDPEMKDRLEKLQATDPAAADKAINETRRKFWWLVDLHRTDKEMFAIRIREITADRKTAKLARSIADREKAGEKTDSPALKADRDLLRLAVQDRQNARIGAMGLELARVEERVKKIRDAIMTQAAENTSLVDTQVEEALERARKGDAPSPGEAGPGSPHERHEGESGERSRRRAKQRD